jgi:anti-sigma regulatory factor (Ser/Thr protein kinase)
MEMKLPLPHVSISLAVEDMSGVSEARGQAMKLAEALGFSESDIGRVALATVAAATNIVEHAGTGEILLRPIAGETAASLELLALDQGPGLSNAAQALRDGFSTSGSKGLGLGAIARVSTAFDLVSTPGKGTALMCRIGPVERAPRTGPSLEWGVVCVAMRGEDVCGDAWAVKAGPGTDSVLIVDGLGHGSLAFEAAQQALEVFRDHPDARPQPSLEALHETMRANRATRGVVAAIVEIAWARRQIRFAGAGNIAGALLPVKGKASNFVSYSGTLGDNVTHFQEFNHPWPDDGLLILHSDGLSPAWALEPYPGLSRKHPGLIAGVLYRDFASRRDDVIVFVGRERPGIRSLQDGDVV